MKSKNNFKFQKDSNIHGNYNINLLDEFPDSNQEFKLKKSQKENQKLQFTLPNQPMNKKHRSSKKRLVPGFLEPVSNSSSSNKDVIFLNSPPASKGKDMSEAEEVEEEDEESDIKDKKKINNVTITSVDFDSNMDDDKKPSILMTREQVEELQRIQMEKKRKEKEEEERKKFEEEIKKRLEEEKRKKLEEEMKRKKEEEERKKKEEEQRKKLEEEIKKKLEEEERKKKEEEEKRKKEEEERIKLEEEKRKLEEEERKKILEEEKMKKKEGKKSKKEEEKKNKQRKNSLNKKKPQFGQISSIKKNINEEENNISTSLFEITKNIPEIIPEVEDEKSTKKNKTKQSKKITENKPSQKESKKSKNPQKSKNSKNSKNLKLRNELNDDNNPDKQIKIIDESPNNNINVNTDGIFNNFDIVYDENPLQEKNTTTNSDENEEPKKKKITSKKKKKSKLKKTKINQKYSTNEMKSSELKALYQMKDKIIPIIYEPEFKEKNATFGNGRYSLRNRVPTLNHDIGEKIQYVDYGNGPEVKFIFKGGHILQENFKKYQKIVEENEKIKEKTKKRKLIKGVKNSIETIKEDSNELESNNTVVQSEENENEKSYNSEKLNSGNISEEGDDDERLLKIPKQTKKNEAKNYDTKLIIDIIESAGYNMIRVNKDEYKNLKKGEHVEVNKNQKYTIMNFSDEVLIVKLIFADNN